MNSNMLAGEKRWASARRGGMTVLGKVAVPKPLNLPSQRLENQGLDPNVEIVPKGTLSWGRRPSSSVSNPWVSLPSPNAEGGPVSPGHPSGRPSSGGSGTRPSTSGSDKAHETITNASTSRPTSSSGTFSSNQTQSTSLNSRSTENRPTSSHLSRFAEPVSRHPIAWGPSMAAEKMGLKSTKKDGFSLSSGDFPNLGSEKDNLEKNNESEDLKSEFVNIWNADGSSSVEDVKHPVTGKRHGEPPQYFNANAPPQPFEAWRGPPMNGPAGVWYGGHPRGPALGVPNTPGGFPVEAFPYYHPQMPPPHLEGSQPAPPGAGPRRPHSKGGDLFRARMPDPYGCPNMPFRPGFYPGPPGPMVFESYYRPPIGYCNNERDVPPFMGIAAGHLVYNGFGVPGVDTGHALGRPAARVPSAKVSSDHMDIDCSVHNQAPKRAPEGSPNECNQIGGENQSCNLNASNSGRKPSIIFSRKNEWGAEKEIEETPNEDISFDHKYALHTVDSELRKLHGGVPRVKTEADEWNGPQFAERSNLPRDVSSVAHGGKALIGPKHEPTAVLSRKPYNAKQIGVDHRDDDHQLRRPLSSESSKMDTLSSVNVQILNLSAEDEWNSASNQPGNEGDLIEPHVAIDIQDQRSKMRELAKQRAMQLQNEEEERMKEQKTKALAKLEELNRRTLSSDSSYQKAEKVLAMCENEASEKADECVKPALVDTNFLEFGTIMWNQDEKAVGPICSGNQGDKLVEFTVNVKPSTFLECVASPVEMAVDSHAGSLTEKSAESGDVGIPIYQGMKQIEHNSFMKSMTGQSGTVVPDAESVDKNAATDDVLSHENLRNEISLTSTNIDKTSKVVTVSSAHQRKRSSKNGKYKHKSNEVPKTSALADAVRAMDSGEVSIKNTELKSSFSDSDNHALNADKPDEEVSAQQCSSVLTEEFNRKVSVQWKPDSRRFPRSGQQGNRFVEKLHSNGNVMWAPVKAQNKVEVNIESNPKSEEVSANYKKGDSSTQNTSKGKRAEIERYVPKPVAMELAHQSGIQPLSSISSFRSVESTQKEQTRPGSSGSVLPTRCAGTLVGSGLDITEEYDSRLVKLKLDSGTWRQCSSVDSSDAKIPIPDHEKSHQQSKETDQSIKNKLQPSGHESKPYTSLVNSDDKDILSSGVPALSKNPSVKAIGPANRGKRQFTRGFRSTGGYFDSVSTVGNGVDGSFVQHLVPNESQTEKGNFSRENRRFGERISSHWQPKTQSNPSNEHITQGIGSESPVEGNKHSVKGIQQQYKIQPELTHANKNSKTDQSQQHHRVNVKRVSGDSNTGQIQEREKNLPTNERVHSPTENQELVPNSSKDAHQHERNLYSGYRGNIRHNNRFYGMHDSRGEWPAYAHDNANAQEKQKQNVHSGYQPVGSKNEMVEDQAVVSKSGIQRQGQKKGPKLFHSRGRQSSSISGGY